MLSALKAKGLLWPAVMTLAGLAILVSLGNWQMQRLAWKEGLDRRDRRARRSAEPVSAGRGRLARLRRRRHRVHARQGRAAGCSTTRSCISTPSTSKLGPGYHVYHAAAAGRRQRRAGQSRLRPRGPQGSRDAPGRADCRRRRDHGPAALARTQGHVRLRTTTRQKTSGSGAISSAWPRPRWAPTAPRTVPFFIDAEAAPGRPAAGRRAASRGSSCRTGTWNMRSPGTASPPPCSPSLPPSRSPAGGSPPAAEIRRQRWG